MTVRACGLKRRLKRSDAQRALASLILVGPSGTQLAHTESGWVCGMCMHSLHASSLFARPMNNVNYHFASLRAVFFTVVDRSPPPQYKSNTGQRDHQDASLMMRNGVDSIQISAAAVSEKRTGLADFADFSPNLKFFY